MSTESTKAAGEDSRTSPAGLCPSHPEDPTGGVLPKEGDVLPSEMLCDEAVASVERVDPDRGDADREVDPGNHMKTPGAEAAGELSLGVEGDTESQKSLEVLLAHGEEQAVEGQAGVAESLSMTSLSRSITKEDVTCLKSPPVEEGKKTDRMREIGRSQTVPRSFGAQSRRAAVQKAEAQHETAPASTGAKVKPQRSTSLGKAGGSSVKQKLLEWCRQKTRGYQNVDIQNFSSSWNDGMAFCALVHKFFPDSFDYASLAPKNRRQNFELAFSTAEARANCMPLIDVADMIRMGRHPDAKCVFTYVQSLCRQLHNLETKPSAVPTQESNQGHPCPPQAGTTLEEGDGGAGVEAGSGGDLRD